MKSMPIRKLYNKPLLTLLAQHSNIEATRMFVRQLYTHGYVRISIDTPRHKAIKAISMLCDNGGYQYYVLSQYYHLLGAIRVSASKLYMSAPIHNKTKIVITDTEAGPAELLTIKQLGLAVLKSKTIFGNISACKHGHVVIPTALARGHAFAILWSIVKNMTFSKIKLMPADERHFSPDPDVQQLLAYEQNNQWPNIDLEPRLYAALNISYYFKDEELNYTPSVLSNNKRK
jgi:hypothetical protein